MPYLMIKTLTIRKTNDIVSFEQPGPEKIVLSKSGMHGVDGVYGVRYKKDCSVLFISSNRRFMKEMR